MPLPNLPPTWLAVSADDQRYLTEARALGNDLVRRMGGIGVRGMLLAIADQCGSKSTTSFQKWLEAMDEDLKNAFGQVWIERERG